MSTRTIENDKQCYKVMPIYFCLLNNNGNTSRNLNKIAVSTYLFTLIYKNQLQNKN